MAPKLRARIRVCPMLWGRRISSYDHDDDISVQKSNGVSFDGHYRKQDCSLINSDYESDPEEDIHHEEELVLENKTGHEKVIVEHDSDYESDPEEVIHPEEELVLDDKTETKEVIVKENESDSEEDIEQKIVMVEENESDSEEDMEHEGVMIEENESDPEKEPDPEEEIQREVVMVDEYESDPEEEEVDQEEEVDRVDSELEVEREDEVEREHDLIKMEVKKDQHLSRQTRKQKRFVKLFDERKNKSKNQYERTKKRRMHLSLSSRSRSHGKRTSYRKNNHRRYRQSYNSRRVENRVEYGSSSYVGQHHRQVNCFCRMSELTNSESTQFYEDRERFWTIPTRSQHSEHVSDRIFYPASKRLYTTLETSSRYFVDYENHERAYQRIRLNNDYERGQTRGWGDYYEPRSDFYERGLNGGGNAQPIARHDLNIYQREQPRDFSNYGISQTNFRARNDLGYDHRAFIQSNNHEYPNHEYRFRNP